MKHLTVFSFLLFFTSTIFANDQIDPKYFEISEPQVELLEINEDQNLVELRNTPSCIEDQGEEGDRNLDINQLINLGKEIWQIVKDGEPELNFQSQAATAFPSAAKCLFNLTSWSIPQSRTYRITYKNGFGSEVVSMTYKLIYTFGGQFDGRGNYLANVSIHPAQIYVGWGFSFDAQVHIQDILNIGSAESPEAGMQVALEWSVGNVLNKHQSQDIYFVQGSGPLTAL